MESARRPETLEESPKLAATRRPGLVSKAPAREVPVAPRAMSSIYDWTAGMDAAPVQLQAFDTAIGGLHDAVAVANHDVWGDPLPQHLQMKGSGRDDENAVKRAAARGMAGGGGALPHAAAIQRAFGHHDISGVTAHRGVQADEATAAMGARAYASGNHVVLGRGGADLHTVAHEAAHVVQQRSGVALGGGVGKAGDAYEKHADAVADLVVAGQSAVGLLDGFAGNGGGSGSAVQRAEAEVEAAAEAATETAEAEVSEATGIDAADAEAAIEGAEDVAKGGPWTIKLPTISGLPNEVGFEEGTTTVTWNDRQLLAEQLLAGRKEQIAFAGLNLFGNQFGGAGLTATGGLVREAVIADEITVTSTDESTATLHATFRSGMALSGRVDGIVGPQLSMFDGRLAAAGGVRGSAELSGRAVLKGTVAMQLGGGQWAAQAKATMMPGEARLAMGAEAFVEATWTPKNPKFEPKSISSSKELADFEEARKMNWSPVSVGVEAGNDHFVLTLNEHEADVLAGLRKLRLAAEEARLRAEEAIRRLADLDVDVPSDLTM